MTTRSIALPVSALALLLLAACEAPLPGGNIQDDIAAGQMDTGGIGGDSPFPEDDDDGPLGPDEAAADVVDDRNDDDSEM